MPRLLAMLFLLLGLFCAAALPAHADDDFNTTLDRLSRLQALAREFSSSRDDAPDPIVLTLSYTRTGDYNTTICQLTAGVRDTVRCIWRQGRLTGGEPGGKAFVYGLAARLRLAGVRSVQGLPADAPAPGPGGRS